MPNPLKLKEGERLIKDYKGRLAVEVKKTKPTPAGWVRSSAKGEAGVRTTADAAREREHYLAPVNYRPDRAVYPKPKQAANDVDDASYYDYSYSGGSSRTGDDFIPGNAANARQGPTRSRGAAVADMPRNAANARQDFTRDRGAPNIDDASYDDYSYRGSSSRTGDAGVPGNAANARQGPTRSRGVAVADVPGNVANARQGPARSRGAPNIDDASYYDYSYSGGSSRTGDDFVPGNAANARQNSTRSRGAAVTDIPRNAANARQDFTRDRGAPNIDDASYDDYSYSGGSSRTLVADVPGNAARARRGSTRSRGAPLRDNPHPGLPDPNDEPVSVTSLGWESLLQAPSQTSRHRSSHRSSRRSSKRPSR